MIERVPNRIHDLKRNVTLLLMLLEIFLRPDIQHILIFRLPLQTSFDIPNRTCFREVYHALSVFTIFTSIVLSLPSYHNYSFYKTWRDAFIHDVITNLQDIHAY